MMGWRHHTFEVAIIQAKSLLSVLLFILADGILIPIGFGSALVFVLNFVLWPPSCESLTNNANEPHPQWNLDPMDCIGPGFALRRFRCRCGLCQDHY